ncbi:MAG: hypothetical protein WC332_00735 [Clostridia bacterium]
MVGAREYADLLGSGVFEKLSYESGIHARGKTFHIWILNSEGKRTVEVYGIIGGQPGWTESYGWLHSGQWIDDFEKFVMSKKMERAEILRMAEAKSQEAAQAETLRIQTLLKEY